MNPENNRKGYFGDTFVALLEKGLEVDVPVFGVSMFPLYLPGDIVRIKKISYLEFKVGDVIVFEGRERLILHRLVDFDMVQGMAVTKGDGLMKDDPFIPLDKVKGVVIQHSRKGRDVKWTEYSFVKKMMFIITPVTGYFNFYFARVVMKLKKPPLTPPQGED